MVIRVIDGKNKTLPICTGKFGDSAAFAMVFLYTAEIFPTKVRASVVGLLWMACRAGAIVAPQVVYLLPKVSSAQAPMILMGSCALVGGALSTLLPETLGSLTVQSIKDVDDLKYYNKPFFSYWTDRRLKSHLKTLTYQPPT